MNHFETLAEKIERYNAQQIVYQQTHSHTEFMELQKIIYEIISHPFVVEDIIYHVEPDGEFFAVIYFKFGIRLGISRIRHFNDLNVFFNRLIQHFARYSVTYDPRS